MKQRIGILSLGLLLLGASCMNGENIELEGTIKYVGSTPHHYLALDQNGKLFQISNPEEFHLEKLQNHRIKAKVTILKKGVGRGFPPIVKIISLKK